MSYMTTFHLEIEMETPSIGDVAARLAVIVDRTPPGHKHHEDNVMFWNMVLTGQQDASWTDHAMDLKRITPEWPDALLTLIGQGDLPEDEWIEYHRDGRMHREERGPWEPPSFDPARLM